MTAAAPDDLVDPELRPALSAMPDVGELSLETLPTVRASLGGAPLPPAPENLRIERVRIAVAANEPDVGGILYRPAGSGASPAILNLHGGGFVAGTVEREDAGMRALATALGAAVLSLDYRLAPETPFPGALDDAFAALTWLHAQAGTLGIDPARIAVRGVSAGGGLSAGLALRARDGGGPRIAFLSLACPMLDDRTSAHAFAGKHVWPIEANRFAWNCYLGGQAPTSYAAPARAEDLTGLPPTFIATGAIDLFVDEDVDFARSLIDAGVPTELHVYPGAYHGFYLLTDTAVAKRFGQDSLAALHRAFYTTVDKDRA